MVLDIEGSQINLTDTVYFTYADNLTQATVIKLVHSTQEVYVRITNTQIIQKIVGTACIAINGLIPVPHEEEG